ncbi:cytosolic non-specific dipeptidase [Cephus cinctus]|uniref:Cytosolic non-specific dipeptidase n=1 Tax=Cephus cinctus TaxID=211228 RepID=A0AAJ7BY06_CEPCN|nr:cytosolic non-specific dipeptidase [Cephus cinctus]
MPIPPDLVKVYKYVDTQRERYIQELRSIVSIESISSNINLRCKISLIIKWMATRLKKLGFKVQLLEIGKYIPERHNKEVKIPTLILGTLGKETHKKVLLYYCHLDVVEVNREKWTTDPFVLTEKNGKLYGRGTAKMKGSLLCFLHAIECYQALGIELPINIKIICESLNECMSAGLPRILADLKTSFLTRVDCILVTDGKWVGRHYPCILYGCRGVCYFNISIDGLLEDLHSGDYGGIVYEPLQDLLFLLSNLVDPFGHIKVPGFYKDVMQVTPDEEDVYGQLKINMNEYKEDAGIKNLAYGEDITETFMHVWRHPTYNLHYINTSVQCDCSDRLLIPKNVDAKFSIRIVPYQTPEKVSCMVLDYLNKLMYERCTPNKLKITVDSVLKPWYENHLHWNYEAAKEATKQVYKEDANFIRDGNGISILLELHKILPKKNILLLPLVNSEANIHSEDENISLRCYFESTKLLASYFHNLENHAQKQELEKRIRHHNICDL